jgi:hypothetical protein
MVKRIILVVAFVVFGAGITLAELPGLGKVGIGKLSSGSGSSVGDLSNSKGKAVSVYLQSTQELIISLEKAGEAFGVKKEVLEKLSAVKALNEGNINDKALEKARKASEEAQEIIKQKMQETKTPSVESKKLMAESIVHLVSGIQKEQELVGEVQNLSSQAQAAVSSASPMEILKVKDIAGTATALVKAIPMDLKLTKDILSAYLQYAKANNVEIPKNATGLLKGE